MKVWPHSLKGWFDGRGDRGAFFAFGENLEEQLGAAGVDADIAELVDQQQVESSVAADDLGQDPVIGGFGQLVDQLGAGDVADPPAGFAGGHAQAR